MSSKGAKGATKVGPKSTKIRRPSVRRVRPSSRRDCGGGLPPPTPSAWAPHRRSRHRSARFVKRAGTCLHVRPKWTEKRKILRRPVQYFLVLFWPILKMGPNLSEGVVERALEGRPSGSVVERGPAAPKPSEGFVEKTPGRPNTFEGCRLKRLAMPKPSEGVA